MAGCKAVIWCLVLAVTLEVIVDTAVAQNTTTTTTTVRPTTQVFGNVINNVNVTTNSVKPLTLPYDPNNPNNVATVPVVEQGAGGSSHLPTVAKQSTLPYVPPNAPAASQVYSNPAVAGGGSQPVTVPQVVIGGGGSQPVTVPPVVIGGGGSQPVTVPAVIGGGGSQPVTVPAAGGVSQVYQPAAPNNNYQTNYPAGPAASSNTPLYNGQGQGQSSFPAASSNAPMGAGGLSTTPVYMYNILRVQINSNAVPSPMNTVYNPQVASFLATLAQVSDPSRIQNITYQTYPSSSSITVLQFAITQPSASTPTSDVALSNLKTSIQTYSPTWTSMDGQATIHLYSPVLSWTDYGLCPNATCLNGGRCVSSVTGTLSCQCQQTFIGPDCSVAATMSGGSGGQPLLGLLVIPILFVLILIGLLVAFFIMRRRQEEKKVPQVDNDVSSVYTPSKFGTVSEAGVRNMAYPTIGKSYAVAFTDQSFSTMDSSDTGGDRSMGLF